MHNRAKRLTLSLSRMGRMALRAARSATGMSPLPAQTLMQDSIEKESDKE